MAEPQKSLTFVKWDFVSQADEIYSHLTYVLERLTGKFATTEPIPIKPVPEDIARVHYANVSHLPFYEPMVADFRDKGIVARVYTGIDVIAKIIQATGPTDPSKAHPWQVRGKFSSDVLETAFAQKRPVRNVIHRSGTPEEAAQEIERFKRFL